MARYTTAQALRLIMEEDTKVDEDSVVEGDADDSEVGDYLPEVGTASDNEDHVSEESDETEDVSTSDEERVKEPSTTRNTRGRGRVSTARGITRGTRGARRGFCHGRGAHYTPDPTQPTIAEQLIGCTNTIVDRTGRHWTTEPPLIHRRQVQDIIRQQLGTLCQYLLCDKCM